MKTFVRIFQCRRISNVKNNLKKMISFLTWHYLLVLKRLEAKTMGWRHAVRIQKCVNTRMHSNTRECHHSRNRFFSSLFQKKNKKPVSWYRAICQKGYENIFLLFFSYFSRGKNKVNNKHLFVKKKTRRGRIGNYFVLLLFTIFINSYSIKFFNKIWRKLMTAWS